METLPTVLWIRQLATTTPNLRLASTAALPSYKLTEAFKAVKAEKYMRLEAYDANEVAKISDFLRAHEIPFIRQDNTLAIATGKISEAALVTMLESIGVHTFERKAILRHEDSSWNLYSHTGKLLGKHQTKQEALTQETAININKKKAGLEIKNEEGKWVGYFNNRPVFKSKTKQEATVRARSWKGPKIRKGERKEVDPKQLTMGIEVEKEHTNNPEVAEKIARDHLAEIPDYYTRLKKMEDGAKKK